MRTAAALLVALAAAACAKPERPPLAYPKGPWQQMNAGRWEWNENELIRPAPGSALATGLVASGRRP
jgi:hypothetical protein